MCLLPIGWSNLGQLAGGYPRGNEEADSFEAANCGTHALWRVLFPNLAAQNTLPMNDWASVLSYDLALRQSYCALRLGHF